MSFYPAKGNKKNVELHNTDKLNISILCNGDTIINVKDYDKDALFVTGVALTVPAVSGSTWGGEGTCIKDHYTSQYGNGLVGEVTFDGTDIHITQLPSVGTAYVKEKVTCVVVISYVK